MIKWWRTKREMQEAAAKSRHMMRVHLTMKMNYFRAALKKHGVQ